MRISLKAWAHMFVTYRLMCSFKNGIKKKPKPLSLGHFSFINLFAYLISAAPKAPAPIKLKIAAKIAPTPNLVSAITLPATEA